MKIIFVGIHNKIGKPPLCSSTKSGNIIDQVIDGMKLDWEKTNLYDLEFIPIEKRQMVLNWLDRISPEMDDVIVLLGKEVQNNYNYNFPFKVLKFNHPASCYGREKVKAYVIKIIKAINQD